MRLGPRTSRVLTRGLEKEKGSERRGNSDSSPQAPTQEATNKSGIPNSIVLFCLHDLEF